MARETLRLVVSNQLIRPANDQAPPILAVQKELKCVLLSIEGSAVVEQ